MTETVAKIIELKKKSLQIPHTETLDDLKELESYDAEIIDLIYEYCLSQNYNVDGFPEKYLDLIASDDEDFYDFLSFDTKYYYVMKNALIHEDVFLCVKTYINPEDINYTTEDCKQDILLEVKSLE